MGANESQSLQVLQAECLVATMGVPHALRDKPKPPTAGELNRAAKLPEVIKRRVGELLDLAKPKKAAPVAELPDYHATKAEIDRGVNGDALADTLIGVPEEYRLAAAMAWTNAVAYLASILPVRIDMRLTGPKVMDPSHGELAEFAWAWRLAKQPMFVFDLAEDGTLIGREVECLQKMFPALYAEIVGCIHDSMADRIAKDAEWQPPWWLRKQLCVVLGVSPVSSSLVADIDKAVRQSAAEAKMRTSSLKISNTGATPGQRLANEGARA